MKSLHFLVIVYTSLLFCTHLSYAQNVDENDKVPIIISKAELWSQPTPLEKLHLCPNGRIGGLAYQWIEVYNTQNETITANNFNLTLTKGSVYFNNLSLILLPYGSCVYETANDVTTRIGAGGSGGNSPPSGYDGSIVSVQYYVKTDNGKEKYQNSTPELSDTFNDSRTWQYNGAEWTFTDKNISVPEFPLAIPVLLIGITSLVIFSKMRLRV